MACLQLSRSGLVPSFRSFPRHRCAVGPVFHVSCRLGGDNNGSCFPLLIILVAAGEFFFCLIIIFVLTERERESRIIVGSNCIV
jgi:hypothetical protein